MSTHSRPSAPLIGIAGRNYRLPESFPVILQHALIFDALAVQRAGGIPLILPPVLPPTEAGAWLERLDGLYIPGGGDVSAQFNPSADPALLEDTSPTLDRADHALILSAIEMNMPLLCICRGLQTLNTALGGTLLDDIVTRQPHALQHRLPDDLPAYASAHTVRVEPGTKLAAIFGAARLQVNSLHHQAVERVGNELRVSARASDGIVEGLELPQHPFCVGVQWHPEIAPGNQDGMERLFEAFVQAAARRRDG